jgi:hypothetical protein
MICFRDMTFCTAACADTQCHRRLTPDVKAAARRWWGGDDAPIAMADYSDGCQDYDPIKDTPHV